MRIENPRLVGTHCDEGTSVRMGTTDRARPTPTSASATSTRFTICSHLHSRLHSRLHDDEEVALGSPTRAMLAVGLPSTGSRSAMAPSSTRACPDRWRLPPVTRWDDGGRFAASPPQLPQPRAQRVGRHSSPGLSMRDALDNRAIVMAMRQCAYDGSSWA